MLKLPQSLPITFDSLREWVRGIEETPEKELLLRGILCTAEQFKEYTELFPPPADIRFTHSGGYLFHGIRISDKEEFLS